MFLVAACGNAVRSPFDAAHEAAPDAGGVTDLVSEPGMDGAFDAAPDAGRPDAGSEAATDATGAACSLLSASCLGPFFAAADACFGPAGSCTRAESTGTTIYCWENGARYLVTTSGSATWSQGGTTCVHGSRDASMFSLILDSDPSAPLYYFAFATGETACEGTPGRTTVDPSIATCPAFRALLDPDVSACRPGACN